LKNPTGRILAVDPGEKNIGLALSDPSGMLASPLTVLKHVVRVVDAAQIAQTALDHGAVRIIIGYPLDSEGLPGPAARKAERLADAVRLQTELPVELWDESGSTQMAKMARTAAGVSRRKRAGHLDEVAAAVILQSYLDAHNPNLDFPPTIPEET